MLAKLLAVHTMSTILVMRKYTFYRSLFLYLPPDRVGKTLVVASFKFDIFVINSSFLYSYSSDDIFKNLHKKQMCFWLDRFCVVAKDRIDIFTKDGRFGDKFCIKQRGYKWFMFISVL